uniref:Uncharacterized protein n=1 Tax=Lepeophtheirus salmonis TaxID=72036 RepID=A0A0K2SYG0_LEPSM
MTRRGWMRSFVIYSLGISIDLGFKKRYNKAIDSNSPIAQRGNNAKELISS